MSNHFHPVSRLRKCGQRTLHERKGRSFNIEAMTSARSFVRGGPDLESSHREVLPCAKRFCHFFTVGRASPSAAYTDSSSAAIAQEGKLLSVKKQMTARCSMNDLHARTAVNFEKVAPATMWWAEQKDEISR
jgi:hypothetical protein